VHSIAADPRTGYSVDSAQFRRQAPRTQLSDDPDTATEQTVQEMCRQIHEAAKDPLVQRCAVNAVRNFRGGPAWIAAGIDPFSNAQCMAESCWWWCKHFLQFKHHGSMFEAWSSDLGDPRTKLQLLIAPDVLVRMSRMEGDCAIYTMMLCAMLESLGVPFQIVTLAVDEMQPTIFSHVFVRAAGESLDASHGPYPGWQAPAEDIHREWVFDMAGRRVSESPRFGGLHAYRRPAGVGRLTRIRRGFGDVCNPDDPDYDAAACEGTSATSATSTLSAGCPGSPGCPGYVAPTATAAATLAQVYVCSDGSTVSDPSLCATGSGATAGYTAPSQSSAQWASFATQMLKSGMTLAEINAIQPGTVVSANGAILRQSTGYSVSGATTSLSTALGTSSSSLLMLGGLALAAILIMSMGKR
jgi:hypothetical protein